jgi:Family of unknown function (DUF6221)
MACQHERTSETRSGILVCDDCTEPVTYAELLDRTPATEVSAVDELVAFLRAQLDERERDANAALRVLSRLTDHEDGYTVRWEWQIFARQPGEVEAGLTVPGSPSPTEMLADIAAKRAILEECDSGIIGWTSEGEKERCRDIVRLLAQPYAGQDGWRQEWGGLMVNTGPVTREESERFHALAGTMDRETAESRCWACGVEPTALYEVTTLSDPAPRYLPGWPPATDHQHAVRPPTPGELEQAGHETLSRIHREAWTQ